MYWFRAHAILIGDDNLLYCGSDTSRWTEEGCSAVCNSSDSLCPFAMTTAYPESTVPEEPDGALKVHQITTFVFYFCWQIHIFY